MMNLIILAMSNAMCFLQDTKVLMYCNLDLSKILDVFLYFILLCFV